MQAHVLVVDDDPAILSAMRDLLKAEGHKVAAAKTAEEALMLLQEHRPHLIVLDVSLPGFSGIDLCRRLKRDAETAAIPVLMLTSHATERHKVDGLDSGADDYVVKPFSMKEMGARVRALLRRSYHPQSPQNDLRAEGLVVDIDTHTVMVDGSKRDLRPKEFDVLVALMRARGRVLSRNQLAQMVWGLDAIATSHTINVVVASLRDKLDKRGGYIVAIRGVGYKFEEAL